MPSFRSAELPVSIDGVLTALDDIIDDAIGKNNPIALFAYVYRRTTAEIKNRVEAGEFEDNARMEQLDVRFANLFIKAYREFQENQLQVRSWLIAMQPPRSRLASLQHIGLGMNAHINLDLAIAAAETMRTDEIDKLQSDFDLINKILADITDEMQQRLARASKICLLLDWLGQRADERIIDFSIGVARTQSWNVACELWAMEGDDVQNRIERLDSSVVQIGERLMRPRTRLFRFVLYLIKRFESEDVGKLVTHMRS